MGSIHDAASTSSASSSSSSSAATRQGNNSSTRYRKSTGKTRQSSSVASLRSLFEEREQRLGDGRPSADKRAAKEVLSRRRGSRELTFTLPEASAAVDEQKPRRRCTSAVPAAGSRSSAGRRSIGAGSTQLPVHSQQVIPAWNPVWKRNKEPELRISQRDQQGNPNFTVSVHIHLNS